MLGTNILYVNQATMKQIIQEWWERNRVYKDTEFVSYVSAEKDFFKIVLAQKEKKNGKST